MELYFFRKLNKQNMDAFRDVALHHNVRMARLFAAIIGAVALVLYLIHLTTTTSSVLRYPTQYSTAIMFLLLASGICYFALLASSKLADGVKIKAYKFLSNLYAIIIVISSMWITFVMQHNPSNTMSIFVLGILTVAALWIFEELYALIIAITIVILFSSGLHYFQTDPGKLFTNYITAICVSVFFVCISRITFSVNYNHFQEIKKVAKDSEEMAKINAMQTQILSVVAHDLHAPVNNLLTIIDLLKSPRTTKEETEEYYDMMYSICKRSNGIIDELLLVARSEEKDTNFETVCLNDLIADAMHQFSGKAISRQIVFKPPTEKIYASVNRNKLLRVFDNIISNAIKFTTDNGVIAIELARDINNACIKFRDNGIGIPKSLLPLLFSRFSKAGRTGLGGEKSYGLGLSICKLIMKQHHGDIAVASKEHEGTTMTLILPVKS